VERVSHLIVGGGLAGSATALNLASAGHDVVVLERGSFPREKVCGEGLMPHGVHELDQLGLLDGILATEPQPFRGIGYHVGPTRAVGHFPGGGHGLGVRRSRIDAVLHQACQAHPRIDVRTRTRVRGLTWLDDGVRVDTSDTSVHTRILIGADGLGSLVRRKAGLRREHKGAPRYGARVHVQLGDPQAQSDLVEVILGDALEWYITPTGPGQANLALLCEKSVTRTFGRDLPGGLWARMQAEPALAPWMHGAEPLTQARLCGPLRQDVVAAAGERVLLVGDAAGFVDAITGEGMSLSLMEARLAAQTASDALDDPSRDRLLAYDRRRRRATRSLIWFTRLILWGLRQRALAGWAIRNLARHPDAFSRLLGVNTGEREIWQLPPRDVVRLLVGV